MPKPVAARVSEDPPGGYDGDDRNDIILAKVNDEHIFVQMSLDKTQAAGVHERQLLATWNSDLIGNRSPSVS